MRAILLCAGRGRRLGVDEPKCMIPIRGRSLLERHLDHLAAAGIKKLTIVTGHKRDKLASALQIITAAKRAQNRPMPAIEQVYNERYEHGSIVSLQCVADRLLDGGLWMDADVFYPAGLLKRLVRSAHGNCALLDGRAKEQGEEMMLAARGDRLIRIARRVGDGWDQLGESVGFFKVDAEGGAAMKAVLDAEIEAGRLDQEHEDALNIALEGTVFGYERVDDLPWTEIDFPEDVERADELAPEVEHPERQ